jgi:hypothetical protein
MRLSKFASILCTALMGAVFVILPTFASAAGNDPCKILTAEKFSQIMGYTAAIIKNAPTAMSCFYQGPQDSGGQFMILTDSASGPQVEAMLNRRGSSPPPGSGLIGGTYREGALSFLYQSDQPIRPSCRHS